MSFYFKCTFSRIFLSMAKTRPLLINIRPFLYTMTKIVQQTINGKSIDGVFGIQTWDCRMEGAGESTENQSDGNIGIELLTSYITFPIQQKARLYCKTIALVYFVKRHTFSSTHRQVGVQFHFRHRLLLHFMEWKKTSKPILI